MDQPNKAGSGRLLTVSEPQLHQAAGIHQTSRALETSSNFRGVLFWHVELEGLARVPHKSVVWSL